MKNKWICFLFCFFSICSNGYNCDRIDMEREVLSLIAGKGKLFALKFDDRFWSQIKTAGCVELDCLL